MPKLTQSFVRSLALRADEPQKFFMDDELAGFGLRVSQTKKVFYLQMRVGRRVVKRKIGEYGVKSVDQARKAALQMKAQLQSGIDPYAEKHRGADDGILEKLFDTYAHEVEHKETTLRSIERAKKKFGVVQGQAFKTKPDGRSNGDVELIVVKLPSWMKRPYREITQDEVLERFDLMSRMVPARRLSEKPKPIIRSTNHTFKILQAAYNYTIRKNSLAKKGFENPVDILKTASRWARIKRRDSFLDTNKPYFVTWWNACEAYGSRVIGDYILFTLLMAGRSIECATLRWDDVDLKKDVVVFRNTKNKLDYTFPIAPLTRTILERRLKERVNDFVFGYEGSATGRVVCPPQHAIKKIRKDCGEQWSMHDLRRTFTTAMTSLNVHAFTIAHLMKHSPTITITMTLSYAPPTREQLLDALTRLETHLLERVRPLDRKQGPSQTYAKLDVAQRFLHMTGEAALPSS